MIAVFLAVVFLVLFAWDLVYQKRWARQLTLSLRFEQSAVYAGSRAGFTEIIENRKRLPLPVVEAGFRIQKGIEFADAQNIQVSDYIYKRDFFTILGMEGITRKYSLDCRKRGHYTISQVTMQTWDLFFRKKSREEREITDDLYVYAARTDISGILQELDTQTGVKRSSRRYPEDPFEFSSIREYSPRDPMKTINWKATARTGSMMVNTYSAVMDEQVFLYLDVEDRYVVRQNHLTEDSVSVAATLLDTLTKKGLDVGLAVNIIPAGSEKPVLLGPGRGRDFVRQAEQLLTLDFAREQTIPFTELLAYAEDRHRLQDASRIPVWISKNTDQKTSRAVAEMALKEQAGIRVLPVTAGDQTAAQLFPGSGGEGVPKLVIREVAP